MLVQSTVFFKKVLVDTIYGSEIKTVRHFDVLTECDLKQCSFSKANALLTAIFVDKTKQ